MRIQRRALQTAALIVHIDNATGVDQKIRAVENAALQQPNAIARLTQLIVGRAGDDAGA